MTRALPARTAQAIAPTWTAALRRHAVLLLVLTLFLLLGAVYSVVDPVFEASDELNHYPVVQHLAQGGGLPVQRPGQATLWGQEGSQPPLYYALAAALTFWINTDDLPALLRLNPHADRGVPGSHDNKNMIVHTEREGFPWRGTALAVHLIRLWSVLLGAGAVLCTYGIARDLFPDRPWLANGAAAVNAFIPMFLFISASVNNDNLVIFLSSLALLLMVRLMIHDDFRRARRNQLALGLIIGLACLSKLGALALLPLAALALAWPRLAGSPVGQLSGSRVLLRGAPRSSIPVSEVSGGGWRAARAGPRRPDAARARELRQQIAGWFVDCLFVFLPAAAVAGWWYVRNWQLYGDPTGLSAMLAIAGRRKTAVSLAGLLGEFDGFRINFWGLFGGVNVLMGPAIIYQLLDLLTIAALAGLAFGAGRAWRLKLPVPWAPLLLLVAWILAILAGVLRWTSATAASQGRLAFPALSALCLFFVLGLSVWLPSRYRGRALAGLTGLLFILAASVPFTAIRPAYRTPDVLNEADLPATARRVDLRFGDAVRLIGYELDQEAVRPGGTLPITLYWQPLRPLAEDYSISLVLLSARRSTIAQHDTYPGGGTYPTSRWSYDPEGNEGPDQVVRDRYVLDVDPQALGPAPAWLLAGMYRLGTPLTGTVAPRSDPLPVTDGQGRLVEFPMLAHVRVDVPQPTLQPSHPLEANFNGQVRLIGYDLPDGSLVPGLELPLTLYWQVLAPLDRNYKVFIHVLDERNELAGQGDALPVSGFYPTSQWLAGEIVEDAHRVEMKEALEPGSYRVEVGLYDADTGQRLPVIDGTGQATGESVLVATLRYPGDGP